MKPERHCPTCDGHGTVPTGVALDFDSGLYEADDEEPCRECGGAGWTSTETGQATVPGRADAEECAFCHGSGTEADDAA